MRLIVRFTLVLFGAGVVLMVGMMSAGRGTDIDEALLIFSNFSDCNPGSECNGIFRMGEKTRHIQRITPATGWVGSSPDGKWLILKFEQYNDSSLYRIDIRGQRFKQITDLPGVELIEGFSPDGQWVYFRNESRGTYDLYRVRLNGTNQQLLTGQLNADDETIAGWSPDGRWVYVAYIENMDSKSFAYLARMRPDGRDFEPFQSIDLTSGWGTFLGFTPDHAWFIAELWSDDYQVGLYKVRADGTEKILLVELVSWLDFVFHWDSHHEWFYYRVFTSDILPEFKDSLLFRANFDDTKTEQLIHFPTYGPSVVVSPDGEWIYYDGYVGDCNSDLQSGTTWCDGDIHRVRVDGTANQRVAKMEGSEGDLHWTPDHQWIYFIGYDTHTLYRMLPDGRRLENLQVEVGAIHGWVDWKSGVWSRLTLILVGLGIWVAGLVLGLKFPKRHGSARLGGWGTSTEAE